MPLSADALTLLGALTEAHDHDVGGAGQRQPIYYTAWIGGEAMQHPAQPVDGWPKWDKATLEELNSQGLIRFNGSTVTVTENGRALVAQHARAIVDEPVADPTSIVAAVHAQVTSPQPLAWPSVRPMLMALREYWQAGGFSEHGVQLIAVLTALPQDEHPLFRATVVALVEGEYLRATTDLAADGLPVEVAFTDRAWAALDGWPGATPEDLVDNLLAVLAATAQAEPDTQKRHRLQIVIDTLTEIGKATAAEILAKVALGR
jgi:hypothetical protein